MFDELFVDKWDMHKKADLKESMESFTFVFSWKSIKEFKQGEFEYERCETCNVQTVFDDVGAKT